MTQEFKFGVGQKVLILGIDTNGMVRSIQLDVQGISYKVTYWMDGQLREVWLFQDELAKCSGGEG